MNKILIFWVVALFLFNGCAQSLEQASFSYKTHKDYSSLIIIYQHLDKGMKRTDVEHILGAPDYSPIEGQYYYSSTNGGQTTIGVIVDYRDKNGFLTSELQQFLIGPIGE